MQSGPDLLRLQNLKQALWEGASSAANAVADISAGLDAIAAIQFAAHTCLGIPHLNSSATRSIPEMQSSAKQHFKRNSSTTCAHAIHAHFSALTNLDA